MEWLLIVYVMLLILDRYARRRGWMRTWLDEDIDEYWAALIRDDTAGLCRCTMIPPAEEDE